VNRKTFVSLIVVITGLLIYSSCTKIDTTDLGNDLIPAVDNVHTFETILDVETNNFLFPDTTRTYGTQPVPVGAISDDPEFGKTTAQLYLSMVPQSYSSHPFVKKDTVVVDSVVLSLQTSTIYGDSLSQQDFEVYQIDPSADFTDTLYHRIDMPDLPLTGGPVGHKVVDFWTLNDSVYYVNVKDTISTARELRIKLDTSFARQFVNFDTTTQYRGDSTFRTYFKGLAIKVNEGSSPGARGLAYFDMTGANTKLTFYLRIQNNGSTDTIAPSFVHRSHHAAVIRRTPGHGFQQYLTNGVDNDDKIFLASTPGSYASVKIPGLDTLTNRTIHRAELILEKIPSALDNIYTQPPILFIDGVNATGDSTFTMRGDFVYTGSGTGYDVATLEGSYKPNESRYTFNLSRYVQSIVTQKLPNRTLRVYAPYFTQPYIETVTGVTVKLNDLLQVNTPIANGRVVLGGGNHTTNRMRLRIIYSKI
jgi:hypothetical protein